MEPPFRMECAACGRMLSLERVSGPVSGRCPQCDTPYTARLFPALQQKPEAALGEARQAEEESTCFFHEAKRAAEACCECGRYLCALCVIEWEHRPVCSECIERLTKQENQKRPAREFIYYDEIALTLSIMGLLIWYLSPAFVIAVFYLIFRHWNTRMSTLPRGRARFIAAGILVLVPPCVLGLLFLSTF